MRRLTDFFCDTQQINFNSSSATNYMLNFSSPLERLGEAICNSSILAGQNNTICAPFGSILGGCNNVILNHAGGGHPYSAIFGCNLAYGAHGGVFTGFNNCLDQQSDFSAILGGVCSCVIGGIKSVIGGGSYNVVCSTEAGIFSGNNNNISPLGNCSAILGGENNIITGGFSAILGGSGNNDGGLGNVFIAGSGINAGVVGIPNALHVNGLWANGIPYVPGGVGLTAGQIYWDTPPAPDANTKALYIK